MTSLLQLEHASEGYEMQNLIICPWFEITEHCEDQSIGTRGESAGDVWSR